MRTPTLEALDLAARAVIDAIRELPSVGYERQLECATSLEHAMVALGEDVRAEEDAPRIVIRWKGAGLADFTIEPLGVEPAQLFGAAWMLDRYAHDMRDEQNAAAFLEAQRRGQLARSIAGDITARA